MGKTYDDFYPQIYESLNLWWAFQKVAAGRRKNPSVAEFEYHLENELVSLRDDQKGDSLCITTQSLKNPNSNS
jgi:hypothetical protein